MLLAPQYAAAPAAEDEIAALLKTDAQKMFKIIFWR
jgi:hypothetical protein